MKFIAVLIVGLLPMQLLFGQDQSRAQVLKYTLNGVTTEISFINNATAHIFKYRGSNRPDKHSLVVLNSRDVPVKTKISMGQQDNRLIIQSAGLRVELRKIDGTLQFYNDKDALLTAECPDQLADQPVDQHAFEKIDDSITHVSASFWAHFFWLICPVLGDNFLYLAIECTKRCFVLVSFILTGPFT